MARPAVARIHLRGLCHGWAAHRLPLGALKSELCWQNEAYVVTPMVAGFARPPQQGGVCRDFGPCARLEQESGVSGKTFPPLGHR